MNLVKDGLVFHAACYLIGPWDTLMKFYVIFTLISFSVEIALKRMSMYLDDTLKLVHVTALGNSSLPELVPTEIYVVIWRL